MSYPYKRNHLIYIFLLAFLSFSCKKFVEADPPKTALVGETIFSSDATATAAVVGIYSRMMQNSTDFLSGENSITLLSGLSSDELKNYSTNANQVQFYTNSLSPNNGRCNSFWSQLYNLIYTTNSIIAGLRNSNDVSQQKKKELDGEAKFIRAFCYFELLNLFGDVPLITGPDYNANHLTSRNSKETIYQQIVADLTDAENSLASDYATYSGEKIRATRWAAMALLARVYLYMDNWVMAETKATEIINNTSTFNLLSDLNLVFLKNSDETILQFRPVIPSFETFDGFRFILSSTPRRVALSDEMVNAFESGDNRKSSWVGSLLVGTQTYYFGYKYKYQFTASATTPPNEYLTILRLAEQYLIRAEARAQQGNITGAQTDINAIRNRAGLPNTAANSQSSFSSAIEQERRIEMFCEMGHRWFDLKRTNRADAVLGLLKAPNWQPTDTLYPIPQAEITINPNLTQNLGY